MNWEALGAIGEIVGAIGVIATLLYLSLQIRESNRAALHTGTQEILNQSLAGIRDQINNPELIQLWIRGHMADPTLSPEELTRYRFMVMEFVMIWERTFNLHKAGRLDPETWSTFSRNRRQILASKGFQAYLKDRGQFLGNDFQALLAKEMKEADEEWLPQGVEEAITDYRQ